MDMCLVQEVQTISHFLHESLLHLHVPTLSIVHNLVTKEQRFLLVLNGMYMLAVTDYSTRLQARMSGAILFS